MAHDPALEAAILADRDDPAAYLVYADWLEARGDPRSELIALQYRADRVEPENGELLAYRDEYLRRHPALVPALDIWQVRFRWRWGFIELASLEDLPAADLLVLLDHPSCRLLRELLIATPYADAPALARTLLDAVRPSLEHVTFEQSPEPGDPAQAPEAGSWSRLPRLRTLTIAGHALFRTFEHPALRSLALRGDPLGSAASWDLPAVTALSWTAGRDYRMQDLTALEPLWPSHLPSLRHLDLSAFFSRPGPGEAGLLERGGLIRLLPRLETLRLTLHGIRSDAAHALELLHQRASQLAHLHELTVVNTIFPNPLPSPLARLREALPNLRFDPY